MNPIWPDVKSKLSFKNDILLEHMYHKKRLDLISSRVNNSPPKKQVHIINDLKGKIIQLAKQQEIEKNNKILVEKIIKVSSRENSTKRGGNHFSPLRAPIKRLEDSKISSENLRLSHRLESCKPHYSFEKLKKRTRNSEKNTSILGRSTNTHSPKTFY
jgi:hypothetical protein